MRYFLAFLVSGFLEALPLPIASICYSSSSRLRSSMPEGVETFLVLSIRLKTDGKSEASFILKRSIAFSCSKTRSVANMLPLSSKRRYLFFSSTSASGSKAKIKEGSTTLGHLYRNIICMKTIGNLEARQ